MLASINWNGPAYQALGNQNCPGGAHMTSESLSIYWSQVRILLNKADEITAEELLKIQGNLVWNVSPHMSSSLEPPILYAGSFW